MLRFTCPPPGVQWPQSWPQSDHKYCSANVCFNNGRPPPKASGQPCMSTSVRHRCRAAQGCLRYAGILNFGPLRLLLFILCKSQVQGWGKRCAREPRVRGSVNTPWHCLLNQDKFMSTQIDTIWSFTRMWLCGSALFSFLHSALW